MKTSLADIQDLFKKCKFPKKYFLQRSDMRAGNKIAIFKYTGIDSVEPATNFYSFSEMLAYLNGRYDKMEKIR